MKTYSNEKLIKRNTLIGNITSLTSIAVLGVGMYLSFKDTTGSQYLTITYTCLIVGFLLFQVGNYFTNRFGKPPRPDQRISQALKGLDDKYTLYHYMTNIPHLLVGPSGIYCLLPYNQIGTITYNAEKNRWKQTGGNFFLKTFGGESLGRPENDSQYTVGDITKFFQKKGVDLGGTIPEPVLVFTNEKATIDAGSYEGLVVISEKLKELIRKRAKSNPVPPEVLSAIQQAIEPK
jgi:hypothetical protein